jgi:hypothetical protein
MQVSRHIPETRVLDRMLGTAVVLVLKQQR